MPVRRVQPCLPGRSKRRGGARPPGGAPAAAGRYRHDGARSTREQRLSGTRRASAV